MANVILFFYNHKKQQLTRQVGQRKEKLENYENVLKKVLLENINVINIYLKFIMFGVFLSFIRKPHQPILPLQACPLQRKENDAQKASNIYKCPAWQTPRNSNKYLMIKRHENNMEFSYRSLYKNNPNNLYVKNSKKH